MQERLISVGVRLFSDPLPCRVGLPDMVKNGPF